MKQKEVWSPFIYLKHLFHAGSTKPQAPVFSISTHNAWITLIIASILPFTLPVGTVCQHSGLQPRMTKTHRRLHLALASQGENWSRNMSYSLDFPSWFQPLSVLKITVGIFQMYIIDQITSFTSTALLGSYFKWHPNFQANEDLLNQSSQVYQ